MKNQRLKQMAYGLLIVLSLFASSFAACTCSHHSTTAENQVSSCHQMTMDDAGNAQVSGSNEYADVDVSCNCFVKNLQPFVVAKSENVKTEKSFAVLPSVIETERFVVTLAAVPVKSHFERHFYNSNYLEKLTPARAPPVS